MSSFVPGAIGEGLPIIKANAKAGRFTVDDTSVTRITFIADVENAEAGWMRFGENMSPDFRLVPVKDLLAGKPYPVGTDGGQTLTWQGRIVVVGAVTTAWDTAHSVVAAMGDRFVLVRADSSTGRLKAGGRAMRNVGREGAMRTEMADAVGRLIDLTDKEMDRILRAANLVTLARTGVEFDYRGDVIDAHAPEMPTRFAKQLSQILRGSVAIGMPRQDALELAIRCARDSMPPLRLELLHDVADHFGARVMDIRRRVNKPRMTVDRQLQALHILGLLTCEETEEIRFGRPVQVRHYTVAADLDLATLTCPEM